MELKEEESYRKLRLATAVARSNVGRQKHLCKSPYDARSSQDRLRTIVECPGDKRMRNERERLYNKVRQMEQDIALLENNIGFFSKSKNAEAMIADIKEKIAKSKRELQDTIEKIRLIDSRSEETADSKE